LFFQLDKAVSHQAQLYITSFLPGVLFNAMNDCFRRYLNMMGKTWQPMLCQLSGILIHVCCNIIFVWNLQFGVVGAGISTSLANFVVILMLVKYSRNQSEIKESLVPFKMCQKQEIQEYLKLGLPSAVMLSIEVWAFEIVTLFAGVIGVDQQAANVVMINSLYFIVMFGYGLQTAASSLIGF